MKLFEYNKRREREREREPGATEVGTTQVDGIIFDSFKEEEEEKKLYTKLDSDGSIQPSRSAANKENLG